MTLNYVELVLDLYDGQGNLLNAGTASLAPSVQLTDTTDNEVVVQAPVTAVFRFTGVPQVKLLATDNANLSPSGWAWTVTFDDVPGDPAAFSFFLPYTGGATQYLSALAPVYSATTMAGYLPLPSGTATSGQVPAASGTGSASAWTTLTAAGIGADASGAASTAQSNAETFATSAVATETSRAETAEALLAPKASPTFTGTPASTTPSAGDSSTRIATTAFVVAARNYGGIFGTGTDGAITLDGSTTYNSWSSLAGSVYTLTRDVFATSLTINNGVTLTLRLGNYRIFCAGTVTVNSGGAISNNGPAASAGTGGSTGGSNALIGNRSGGNGGTGVSGAGGAGSGTNFGFAGGAGGVGTSGSAGAAGTVGTVSGSAALTTILSTPYPILIGGAAYAAGFSALGVATGGGGGGSDASSNAGGGGGAGAGIVPIMAWALVNNGSITATGGNGANGTAGNAGGGGGGGGGLVVTYTLSAVSGSGTTSVSGGTLGSKATGGTGSNGSNGTSGLVVNIVLI